MNHCRIEFCISDTFVVRGHDTKNEVKVVLRNLDVDKLEIILKWNVIKNHNLNIEITRQRNSKNLSAITECVQLLDIRVNPSETGLIVFLSPSIRLQ